jgi:hypothetical protein
VRYGERVILGRRKNSGFHPEFFLLRSTAHGEIPLKNLFPELFAIACGKDSWVEENMQKKNGNILWNIYVLNLYVIGR